MILCQALFAHVSLQHPHSSSPLVAHSFNLTFFDCFILSVHCPYILTCILNWNPGYFQYCWLRIHLRLVNYFAKVLNFQISIVLTPDSCFLCIFSGSKHYFLSSFPTFFLFEKQHLAFILSLIVNVFLALWMVLNGTLISEVVLSKYTNEIMRPWFKSASLYIIKQRICMAGWM